MAIVTFRLGSDAVATAISQHVASLRILRSEFAICDKVLVVSGGLERRYWPQLSLGAEHVLLPGLGIDCPVTQLFYQPIRRGSREYRVLPRRIWAKAEKLATRLTAIVKRHDVGLLVVENVNSLPYNICAAIALVLMSERLRLPVLNICHDFYWEHRSGTRARLFVNGHLPEVFGLLDLLCPWRSVHWSQATTTFASKSRLLNRGWKSTEVDVLPYVIGLPPLPSHPSPNSSLLVERERKVSRLWPEAFRLANVRACRISAQGRAVPRGTMNLFVILAPCKISSGKRLHLTIRLLQLLLRHHQVQTHLRVRGLRPLLVVAGPRYDAPEPNSFMSRVDRSVRTLFGDPLIPKNLLQGLSILFLCGVPRSAGRSGSGAVTMDTLYGSADIVVLTSARETWGLPILEAAAFGVPTITTSYVREYKRLFREVTAELTLGVISGNALQRPALPRGIINGFLRARSRRYITRRNRASVRRNWSPSSLRRKLAKCLRRSLVQ